jgi:hypothetical protein
MIPYNSDPEHFFLQTLRFFSVRKQALVPKDRQGHSNSPAFALQAGKRWTKNLRGTSAAKYVSKE